MALLFCFLNLGSSINDDLIRYEAEIGSGRGRGLSYGQEVPFSGLKGDSEVAFVVVVFASWSKVVRSDLAPTVAYIMNHMLVNGCL
jgi:hypothetical protein